MTTLRSLLAAALLAAGLAGCTLQWADSPAVPAPAPAPTADKEPAREGEEPFGYAQYCMEEDLPVVLLKAEPQGDSCWKHVDPWDDSQSYYGVPCRVLLSHKLDVPVGALVFLRVYSEEDAKSVRHWFVAGEADEEWMPQRLSADKSVYEASSLDHQGFDGAYLLRGRGKLRGVWGEMSDMVAAGKAGGALPQVEAPAPAAARDAFSGMDSRLLPYAESDSPVMLLKVEGEQDEYCWSLRDRASGGKPVFCVRCRVLVSHKMECPEGALVFLRVPACEAPGKESLFAEKVRYWVVAGGKGVKPVRRLSVDDSVYAASALEHNAFDGDCLLRPDWCDLPGVWRRMADMAISGR